MQKGDHGNTDTAELLHVRRSRAKGKSRRSKLSRSSSQLVSLSSLGIPQDIHSLLHPLLPVTVSRKGFSPPFLHCLESLPILAMPQCHPPQGLHYITEATFWYKRCCNVQASYGSGQDILQEYEIISSAFMVCPSDLRFCRIAHVEETTPGWLTGWLMHPCLAKALRELLFQVLPLAGCLGLFRQSLAQDCHHQAVITLSL